MLVFVSCLCLLFEKKIEFFVQAVLSFGGEKAFEEALAQHAALGRRANPTLADAVDVVCEPLLLHGRRLWRGAGAM